MPSCIAFSDNKKLIRAYLPVIFPRLLVVILMTVSGGAMAQDKGAAVDEPGNNQGLSACPDSPNCVSSLASDPRHKIEPLPMQGGGATAINALRTVIEAMPRTRIVKADEGYLHAEFTSLIFRFVDDVEFVVDNTAGVIHVRSASRIGYSDLGVNRKRVYNIHRRYLEKTTAQ